MSKATYINIWILVSALLLAGTVGYYFKLKITDEDSYAIEKWKEYFKDTYPVLSEITQPGSILTDEKVKIYQSLKAKVREEKRLKIKEFRLEHNARYVSPFAKTLLISNLLFNLLAWGIFRTWFVGASANAR
ncbi:MAG: hypothetical protein ABW096_07995 [Candidatus Thiodiazotropha sp.]